MNAPRLSMGPVLFNWSPERWRDFHVRIADEADVDTVHVGEAVCSKRTPFFAPHLAEVVERLTAAGKEVVLSTLALVMNAREMDEVRAAAADSDLLVEANDVSAAALLAGRPHVVGPFVNTYNEGTLAFLARRGAVRACLPVELPGRAIAALAAADGRPELEVMVFGRLPLAISARCYHARARRLHKDNCQYVCADDPDGMDLETLDGQEFLAVNGVQTLSHACANLAAEVPALREMGVERLRLSPHTADMVGVAAVFRDVAAGRIDADEADARLEELVPGMPFANGYFHGAPGARFLAGDEAAE